MLVYLGFHLIFSFVDCSRTLPRKNYGTLVLYFYFLFIKCYVLGLISSKKKVKKTFGAFVMQENLQQSRQKIHFFSLLQLRGWCHTHMSIVMIPVMTLS